MAEGRDFRENIALASGLTVPEAYAAGMLPYQVIAAVRKTDAITAEECRQAMIDVGASTLLGQDRPQLRFATMEDAEAVRNQLAQRASHGEPVWIITKEVGKVDEWLRQ